MSRTRHRGKSPGFEFNAKRVGNASYCGSSGRDAKRVTHRRERRIAKRLLSAFALLLCLTLCGCLRPVNPPAPEPDVPVVATEMDRYFVAFRACIGKALGDTAAGVDGLDEAGYRKLLGANLKRAAEAAHGELSKADQALSDSGYTPAKAKEMLLRRQQECASGQ